MSNTEVKAVDLSPEDRAFLEKIHSSLATIVRACGLDMKEFLDSVQRVYDQDKTEVKPVVRSDEVHKHLPMAMSVWHSDPDYCDGDGRPLPIPMEGEAPSFENLFERTPEFVGSELVDPDFNEIERLLVSSECVEKDEDGKFHALRPVFRFATDDALLLITLLRSVSGFLGTIEHNVTKGQGGHFQSYAWSPCFPRKNIPLLKKEVLERGTSFLVDVDAFLMDHEDSEGKDQAFAGAGVYLYFDS